MPIILPLHSRRSDCEVKASLDEDAECAKDSPPQLLDLLLQFANLNVGLLPLLLLL